MADISITAANVLASAFATKNSGVAASTITAGQTLYRLANGTIAPADANGTTPAFNILGISLHAALAGQPITYVTSDPQFQFGGTVAIGDVVIASATAGGIAPIADKVSGWYVTELGVAISTTKINMKLVAAGVAT